MTVAFRIPAVARGVSAYATGEADLHIAGSDPTGALGTAIAAQRGVDGTLTVLIGAPGEAGAQGRVWGMRATR